MTYIDQARQGFCAHAQCPCSDLCQHFQLALILNFGHLIFLSHLLGSQVKSVDHGNPTKIVLYTLIIQLAIILKRMAKEIMAIVNVSRK